MWPVTVESTPNAERTPQVNRQPMGSQQIRIAVLVVLAVIVGVVLWLVLGHSAKHNPKAKSYKTIGPIGYTAKNLKRESASIHTKFFWAGPVSGNSYEFTRDYRGYLYVRYLPHGIRPGAKGGHFLIIATYPFPGAYEALKKQAGSNAVVGPDHSIVYVRPKDRKSVLMAFPNLDYQVEVFDHQPAVALATAESGKIKFVR